MEVITFGIEKSAVIVLVCMVLICDSMGGSDSYCSENGKFYSGFAHRPAHTILPIQILISHGN